MSAPDAIDPTDPRRDYDRAAASAVLARLALGGLFSTPGGPVDAESLGPARTIGHRSAPVTTAPGSHLTTSQLGYLTGYMQPAHPDDVTTATTRIAWDDGDGVPNVAHHGPGGWGAVVPVVAREAVLALWRDLEAHGALAARAAGLEGAERAVLAGTTTDGEPLQILRVGVEAAARVLVQHAYLADPAVHDGPANFARALRDSEIFSVVASTWYWELQASTHRRGMIPVRFEPRGDGLLRYTPAGVALLRAMKDRTIAVAQEVIDHATTVEGLSLAEAVHRYHVELDEVSRQYALLAPGEHPRCLAQAMHDVHGTRVVVLHDVVHAFVETFVRLLDLVTVVEMPEPGPDDRVIVDLVDRTFHVPDMSCAHCTRTVDAVLTGMGLEDVVVDLESKRVVARFPTVDLREEAFEAIRAAGYTVVPPRGER